MSNINQACISLNKILLNQSRLFALSLLYEVISEHRTLNCSVQILFLVYCCTYYHAALPDLTALCDLRVLVPSKEFFKDVGGLNKTGRGLG